MATADRWGRYGYTILRIRSASILAPAVSLTSHPADVDWLRLTVAGWKRRWGDEHPTQVTFLTTILILSSRPAVSTPGTPSLITSQRGLLQTTCSSTEQGRLKSSSRTADASLRPTIHPHCQTPEAWTLSKVLGVCFTNHLSMSDHIHDVIGSCGQSMHAIKVLPSHGMNDDALRNIYKAVVLAK